MRPEIELVVDSDCPNIEAVRSVLREALACRGLPSRWNERIQRPEDPDRVPSPTILVDGEDIEGAVPKGAGCRLYRDAGGRLSGAPSVASVVRALATLDR